MSSDLRSIRFQFFLRICKRRDASQNCRAVFFMPCAARSRQKSTDFFVRHGTKRRRHTVNGGKRGRDFSWRTADFLENRTVGGGEGGVFWVAARCILIEETVSSGKNTVYFFLNMPC